MDILGIETSCDETACAVVRDGREVLSDVVYTQIPLHRPYGGVVPEVASRAHVEKIGEVVAEALGEYREKTGRRKPDAVAATYGPGLASALLVGHNMAKGLAMSMGVPLYGVNHIEAHLHTPFLAEGSPAPEECMPALGLAVSGGHTTWMEMPEYGKYRIIGQTLDDAAGEAFDKAAKLLGLGYPGGPAIDRWARGYWAGAEDFSDAAALAALPTPERVKLPPELPRFPKGHPREGTAALAGLDAAMCVSFSGLKTALLYHVKRNPPADDREKAGLVAAYQEAIVGAVADRTRTALKRGRYRALIVGGGVSLNGRLRAELAKAAEEAGAKLLLARPRHCGDNAAMIAGLAHWRRNVAGDAALGGDVDPALAAGD